MGQEKLVLSPETTFHFCALQQPIGLPFCGSECGVIWGRGGVERCLLWNTTDTRLFGSIRSTRAIGWHYRTVYFKCQLAGPQERDAARRISIETTKQTDSTSLETFLLGQNTPHYNLPSLVTIPQEKRRNLCSWATTCVWAKKPCWAGHRCRETRQTIRDVHEGVQKVKHNRVKALFWISRSLPLYTSYPLAVWLAITFSRIKKNTVRIKIQFTNVA